MSDTAPELLIEALRLTRLTGLLTISSLILPPQGPEMDRQRMKGLNETFSIEFRFWPISYIYEPVSLVYEISDTNREL